eukprot:147589_1
MSSVSEFRSQADILGKYSRKHFKSIVLMKNNNNYHRECKKLMQSGLAPVINRLPNWLWIKSLNISDSLDVYEQRGSPQWFIGTICDKIELAHTIKLLIHYNGWANRYDEWVMIKYTNTQSIFDKINKLHTHTCYHNPLNYNICNHSHNPQINECIICNQKLCMLCIPTCQINNNWQCKNCTINQEESLLFHTIRNTIKQNDNRSEYLFIDNIILIITKFAIGYV